MFGRGKRSGPVETVIEEWEASMILEEAHIAEEALDQLRKRLKASPISAPSVYKALEHASNTWSEVHQSIEELREQGRVAS